LLLQTPWPETGDYTSLIALCQARKAEGNVLS